ncbi:MAG: hypothetical protein RRB13_14885 [bacterium]|nr:hypothetical protein [bacterium]
MQRLFIINSKGSKRTAQFWRRHGQALAEGLPGAEQLAVDARSLAGLESYQEYDQLILVGDDSFFHLAINQLHGNLLEKESRQHYAFLPDHRESALGSSLELPSSLKSHLELLRRSPTIPFDLVRCDCIGTQGTPARRLILNDALIRLPQMKLPLVLRTVVQWFRTYSGIFQRKAPSKVTLFEHGEKRFEGEFVCAIMLLGNKITDGPRLNSKRRFLRKRFAYYQLNANDLLDYTTALPRFLDEDALDRGDDPNIFQGNFTDLDIRGLGEENRIIADGVPIGRLPASFTLLPKALSVVSPMTPVQKLEPSRQKLAKASKPVGNLKTGA